MAESTRNFRPDTPRRRGPGRPFEKDNPGKPKGARKRTTVLAEKLMTEASEDVVRAVIDAAKGGDMQAARIVMDRIAPVRRGRPVQFDLPEGEGAAGIAEAFAAVTKAVADGELTPEEGSAVGSVLEARRRAIEMIDFEQRLKALEEKAPEWTGRR